MRTSKKEFTRPEGREGRRVKVRVRVRQEEEEE